MTKIVPNDLLNPTEKTIKNWNCSFIAVEGPNILDKISLEDLEIPYESQYRSRIILKAGELNQPLIYGFIGKAVTFLMVKVTYDSENDPYYKYEQEKYNIEYYFENDPILRPLGRLLIMTGSIENRIPQIYLNNPLSYDVVLDVLHATLDAEFDDDDDENVVNTLLPIKITGVTLSSLEWSFVGGYYQYTYSNANITTKSIVTILPHIESLSIYNDSSISNRIETLNGSCIIYAINSPMDDILVDIIIVESQ